jgi:hypothetical protein
VPEVSRRLRPQALGSDRRLVAWQGPVGP